MATRNIVPRANGEGSIGTAAKHWGAGHFDTLPNWQEYLAESTGYGIVSGCEPTISGLTVTVAAGVVHIAGGTRKEIDSTSITLNLADSTNPRFDVIYISKNANICVSKGVPEEYPVTVTASDMLVPIATIFVSPNFGAKLFDTRLFLDKNNKKYSDYVGINGGTSGLSSTYSNEYGIKWVRGNFDWSAIESVAGVYDFSATDITVKKAISNGQNMYWSLAVNNTIYGATDNFYPIKSAQITPWIAYVKVLAKRYRGLGITYSFKNEPSAYTVHQYGKDWQSYFNAAKLLYSTIKSEDPTAKVVLGDFIVKDDFDLAFGVNFMSALLQHGMADYVDAISIHAYGTEDILTSFVKRTRSIIKNNTEKNIPIWITEFGWSTWQNGVTEDERAKLICRYILTSLSLNIEHVFIYTTITSRSNPLDKEQWFGIFNTDYTPLDAATAIKNLYEELKEYRFVGRCYSQANDYILMFTNGENCIFKYWTIATNHYGVICGETVEFSSDIKSVSFINNGLPVATYVDTDSSNTVETGAGNTVLGFANSKCSDDAYGNLVSGYYNEANGQYGLLSGGKNKSIGVRGTASGYGNVVGRNCASFGMYNCAIGGTIYEVSSRDADNKTYTLNSATGLSAGKKLWTNGEQTPCVEVTIESVSGNTITVDDASTPARFLVLHTAGTTGDTITSGLRSIATGECSTAIGDGCVSKMRLNFSIGSFNIISTNGNETTTNGDLFIIGNGTSNAARSNAFRVNVNGQAYAKSAVNSTGADYAEYFEWSDGNIDKEDRAGYFVTFDNENKIRLANEHDDYILGVVSGNPAILGNSYNDQWEGMYVTDDFGRIKYEDVDVKAIKDDDGTIVVPAHTEKQPVINYNYDNTQEYVGRENRHEWSAIGMIGVLSVRDNGTCKVNSYCKVTDGGIATASNRGYRVIKRVSENVVKILFR